MNNIQRIPRLWGIYSVRIYQQYLSRFTGNCRHSPSCSSYMIRSINNFGLLKGVFKGYQRLRRCGSKKSRGYDPVPKTFKWSQETPLNEACIYQTNLTFDTTNFTRVIAHNPQMDMCDADFEILDCDFCCCDADCC